MGAVHLSRDLWYPPLFQYLNIWVSSCLFFSSHSWCQYSLLETQLYYRNSVVHCNDVIGLFSVKIEFEEVMGRKMIRVVGGKRSLGERQLAFFSSPFCIFCFKNSVPGETFGSRVSASPV